MPGVLLTGATGLVGQAVLPRLLAHDPDIVVFCVIRAPDAATLDARRADLLARSGVGADDAHRVVGVAGDVERDDLGIAAADDVAAQVDVVVHAAANTRFGLPIDEARNVNTAAARRVAEFALAADAAGGCRRLHHISTAYVAGDAEGVVAVPPLDPIGGFRNTYEQTKWEAEQEIRAVADRIPVTITRPSIVVGDSRTGATPHFRVLYEPMKWVYFHSRSDGASFSDKRGNVLPCRPDVRLDVVPVDYVADAVVALTQSDGAIGGTHHVSAGPERALTIAETVDIVLDTGNRLLEARGEPPVERPTLVSPDMLAENAELRELFALGEDLMAAYLPYGLREQLFDPAATLDVLGDALGPCPDPREYYPVIVEYASAHNFGRSRR
jgi:thioester reductase-like protein